MKIALCLHGLFDSKHDKTSKGLDGFNYIKKTILDKHDVDVYIHSWEVDKKSLITDLYSNWLKDYIFEPQKDFTGPRIDRIRSLRACPRDPCSVMSHFYSIEKSFKLAYSKHEDYDCVIKSRFDLGQINKNTSGSGKQNPFPVQCINLLESIKNNTIYMALWNYFDMGPADMWFYGDKNTMLEFCYIYQDFEPEFDIDTNFYKFASTIENNPGNVSNSIAFYKFWMMSNGLWRNKTPLNVLGFDLV